MSDPIPNDTPARSALIEILKDSAQPLSGMLIRLLESPDEDDAARAAHFLDSLREYSARLPLVEGLRFASSPLVAAARSASAEIHAILRARGLIVTSRGKLARIVDDSEMERRYQIRREAGEDPDARHDDGGVRNGVIVPEVKP